MSLLLRWLGGALGPWIAGAIAAAFVALAGYAVVLRLEVAALSVRLASAGAKNVELQGELEQQNAAVEAFAGECKARADQAVSEALRALAMPPPAVKGSGPKVMNTWLRERFPPSR